MAGIGLALAGCGDSGPSGPNAKAIEEFEELGLSQGQAEAEVSAADREARKQIKREAATRKQNRSPGETSNPGGPEKQTPAQTAGFTGKYEEGYEIAVFICGNYPRERIAKEFHLSASANSFEVAEAYADGYWVGSNKQP
ncbi:MAG TPA: hypothetical protein VF081_04305 [Solirubrobacterales bacterium]